MKVLEARDAAYNRIILEKNRDIILEGLEYSDSEDSPKYLNSGLNSIMAKIASKNRNILGIRTSKLAILPKRRKAIILARIGQNIRICKKANAGIAIDLEKREERSSLIESLGGSTKQSSQAISF